ncbi:hypothetical protein F4780DRAFT_796375 [Xylariomycetidae sp. FL0641]|nr:hypothetical protein F4780DRAFT_796375 [Xylariomycetidae sp. FL0641]
MCGVAYIKTFTCQHTEVEELRKTGPHCLLGKHCASVGHVHQVTKPRERRACTLCETRKGAREAERAARTQALATNGFVSQKSSGGPKAAAAATPKSAAALQQQQQQQQSSTTGKAPPPMVPVLNATAQAELRDLMRRDLKAGYSKALLHYVLGLPRSLDRKPLVALFGEGVAGYYRAEDERAFVAVARRTGYGELMETALKRGAGLRIAEEKAAARREQEEREKKVADEQKSMKLPAVELAPLAPLAPLGNWADEVDEDETEADVVSNVSYAVAVRTGAWPR